MVVRDNLRIEMYKAIDTTVPTKIADKNPSRWKLRIKTSDTNGVYIGLDEAVESDSAYWIDTLEELKIEKYKGEVWARAVTGTSCDVYVYEESEERR